MKREGIMLALAFLQSVLIQQKISIIKKGGRASLQDPITGGRQLYTMLPRTGKGLDGFHNGVH